jgi:flagellar basal body-associated protein FliL
MSPAWQGGNRKKNEGVKKMKKAIVFVVFIIVLCMLISAVLYAAEMVTGVAKTFDAKTGRLVMQTATQQEVTFTIPQTVKVYKILRGKDVAVADAWQFLKDNLIKGTKLQLMESEGAVVKIWILEVPD